MQVTNLNFTEEELAALKNSHFFSIKLAATRKIIALFGELESALKVEYPDSGSLAEEGVNTKNGKIFRGENYLNLPYVVLDYPRLFSTASIYAFRTMFWWGNGFSFTLHLQGAAFEKRKNELIKKLDRLKGQNLFICINDTPWQYHFEKDNYIKLDSFLEQDRKEELREKTFIKICSRTDIDQHAEVIHTALNTYKLLMSAIS